MRAQRGVAFGLRAVGGADSVPVAVVLARARSQLKRAAPKHPYVLGLEAVDRVFDRVQGSAEHK